MNKTINSINDMHTLSNGLKIPCIGFGTYNPSGGDNCTIIQNAIEAGYRYFDTASLYETERVLGEAIRKSEINREELFIASKAWIDEMGYTQVKQAFERTLNRLQMDYLDLYLIHWPKASEDDNTWKERNLETWRAMEELYLEGKIKGIGLSNFLPHHIDNILNNCKIKPLVDQLEIHPGYSQEVATAYCKSKDIIVQAWSPLGRSALLEHPVLLKLASKYEKSVAQISLRFLLQKNIIPLVKTSSMERMKENMDIFDFELTWEDMSVLECMPQAAWLGEHPDFCVPKRNSNFEQ